MDDLLPFLKPKRSFPLLWQVVLLKAASFNSTQFQYFSHHQWPQYSNRLTSHSMIFSKFSLLARESMIILGIDLKTFPISISPAFSAFFKLPWIVLIPHVPISKKAGSPKGQAVQKGRQFIETFFFSIILQK